VNGWLARHGYDVTRLWTDIDDVVIKTLISAHTSLRHNYRSCFPSHIRGSACFEILGFDVVMDSRLRPLVIEVPSLTTCSRTSDASVFHIFLTVFGQILRHREYELHASNIEEIKPEVAKLRQTINTAFERRDFRVSVFPQRLTNRARRALTLRRAAKSTIKFGGLATICGAG